jgi:transglutaminase-like putative cysteine protease
VKFIENTDGGLVVTLGTPVSVDQDFTVAWRMQGEPTGAYDIFGATIESETYRADSLVQIHSIDELHTAGQVYPEWMISRYMSLPESVPETVLTLARDLTATEVNPYDRAVAIENYLRQFPYSLNVSTGPAGVDIVEYFLFSLQEGYCDYYASAMVVLARAAGMPARYVSGYIGEHYDESLEAYVITADQAHAWAEIYFPGYGWIQFEPTGGRPAIERPAETLPELPEDFELDFSPLVEQERFSFANGVLIFWLALILFVVVLLSAWLISDWRLSNMTAQRQLPRLYRRLFRYGRWLRLPVDPGVTPFEFAGFLCTHLEQVATGSHWAGWMLAAGPIIRKISVAYVRITFSPSDGLSPDDMVSPYDTMADYKQLRLRLWLLWVMARIYKFWVLRPFFWSEAPLFISTFAEEES